MCSVFDTDLHSLYQQKNIMGFGNVELKKPVITRIVISGGGAKGCSLPGAFEALYDAGVLDGVTDLAGSSVGAIVAAFIAMGITPMGFRKSYQSTQFADLMGKWAYGKGRHLPGVSILTYDGQPLEGFIRKGIIDSAQATLTRIQKDKVAPAVQACCDNSCDRCRGTRKAIQRCFKKIQGQRPEITFCDLALLHCQYPAYFKNLTIPAVIQATGELFIFNSETAPDVEIARACRASASLPIKLHPVTIEINGKKITFIDSGIVDNSPTDYFDVEVRSENGCVIFEFLKNKKPEETLVFAFGEGLDNQKNEVFQALYGTREDEFLLADGLLRKIIAAMMAGYIASKGVVNPLSPQQQLQRILKEDLFTHVQDKTLNQAQAELLFRIIMDDVDYLSNADAAFFQSAESSSLPNLPNLSNYVEHVEKMAGRLTPVLYKPNVFDKLIRGC